MVLSPPPAHALSAQPHWLDRLVVAIELSAHGVLTLVDGAAPSRLREAFLRLRARDPETELIVDVRQLAQLPPGTTVILALAPSMSSDDLDWLNLNRPVVADRGHNIVLWCERDAAGVLARGAPDFFDWISARVDCPPAPAAHAVADVKAAICARAPGIAWDGPGLEETLAAVRPGRPIRRVAVASYQSMIDALTAREPGWLFLEGIESEFHLRRLRWAMAETGRRITVFRGAINRTLPGWWTVQAMHVPISDAVRELHTAGGTGRLAALTGLDPFAHSAALYLLRHGTESAQLEGLLAAAMRARPALQEIAQPSGWSPGDALAGPVPRWLSIAALHAMQADAIDNPEDSSIASSLEDPPISLTRWIELGREAADAGDPEVAIHWFTTALALADPDPSQRALILLLRGTAHSMMERFDAAHNDFEQAHQLSNTSGLAPLNATISAAMGAVLLRQDQPQRAREYVELAIRTLPQHDANTAFVQNLLAQVLIAQGDLVGAQRRLENALAFEQARFPGDHPSVARLLGALGGLLAAQGQRADARTYLERSLAMNERLGRSEPADMVSALRTLAQLHRDAGEADRELVTLERVVAIQRRARPRRTADLAEALTALGELLASTGKLDSARGALEEAAELQLVSGAGSTTITATRLKLASVLLARGDLTGAIAHIEQAIPVLRQALSSTDPRVAEVVAELERLEALQRDLQRTD